nr:RNA-directed DNA polymerase, eukaryota, reverse transcriptase zinc-binding domain protein [Tanacetum cinerariifolium]
MSGSQRSKGDDVQKISTSVFVTNFPVGYGAKDLWNTCKLYGHVVDVFIPDRRTKAGKRFGFVRFIKVLDIDRLINKLCTIWVGRNKIHANVARFQREPLHKQSNNVNNKGTNIVIMRQRIIQAHNDFVIDERVIWVEVEGVPCKWWFRNTFSRNASRWGTLLNGDELEEEGYHSNRICIRTKLKTVVFTSFKMVYRGMPCWVHAIKVPGWVPDFEEDSEEGHDVNDGSHEDDMHGVYQKTLKIWKHEDSLKYPLGFTPNKEGDVPVEKVDNWSDKNRVNDGQEDGVCMGQHVHKRVKVSNDTHESTCSGHFKKSKVPCKGGSILELIDDLVNMGQTMGYDMTGCLAQKAKKIGRRFRDADGHQRWEVVWLIQEVEKVDAIEVAQKAKIKWSIEGDENSKYYHVWDCGIDKAPGPDGLSFGFYRWYWDIIGNDVPNASMVKDFRPISLIGSLYKVIAKVLANRLVTVLDDIVDEIQSAFVTDRQILDGPFILNEIIHWCFKIWNLFVHGFFNGADVNSKKPSWVRWKSVLAAKDVGGLAVSSLFALNRGLIFKWVWRFFSQKDSLWVRVVKALHGEDEKIGKKVQPRYPSTWLNIINEIESSKFHGIHLVSFITPKLGNGVNTSFWDIAWCGDIAFKILVPRLYALESMKNIKVASKLSHGGVTLSNSNDRWSWSLVGSGDFSMSSVRKLIDNAILPKGILKTRWIKEVPIKINVHAWK